MKYPDFIIISAFKAGTSALWYNLNKHPKIHMAKKKESIEMNFWKSTFYKKGHDWYKSFFKDNLIGGEKTPGYYMSKASMREIYNFIPDCKIILCVRHPVDRAYSQFQMNFKSSATPSNFTMDLFKKRYARDGKYFFHLKKNVMPFFDDSQIYVVVMEKMKSNTTKEMKKLFKFLGVEDLNLPSKKIYEILRQDRTRNEDVALSLTENFYRVWDRHKGKLSGEMRTELLNFYKPYNQELFDYIGYEIKEWRK